MNMTRAHSYLSSHRNSAWSLLSEEIAHHPHEPKLVEMMDAVKLMKDFEKVNTHYSEEESQAMKERVFKYLVEVMEVVKVALTIPTFLQKCNEERYSQIRNVAKLKEYCSGYTDKNDTVINRKIIDENLLKATELVYRNQKMRNEVCKKGNFSQCGKVFSVHLNDVVEGFRDKLKDSCNPVPDPTNSLTVSLAPSAHSRVFPSYFIFLKQKEHKNEKQVDELLEKKIKAKESECVRLEGNSIANNWKTNVEIAADFDLGLHQRMYNIKNREKRQKEMRADRNLLQDVYDIKSKSNVNELRRLMYKRRRLMLLIQTHANKYDDDVLSKMQELEVAKQNLKVQQETYDNFMTEYDRMAVEYETTVEMDHAEKRLARARRWAKCGGCFEDEADNISEDMSMIMRIPFTPKPAPKKPVKKRK